MIKAVLFDYGGVLSPGGRSLSGVYSKLLGIPKDKIEYGDLHKEYRAGDISTEDFFIKLSEQYGKNLSAEEFVKYSDIFQRNQALYALTEELRRNQITTGILSNIYKVSADILRKDGYYDGFSPLVLSCDEGMAKPDPDFYKLAVERLGCKPDEVLFIDDQEKLLPPARKLGLHTIKADNEAQVIADIKKVMKKENGLQL